MQHCSPLVSLTAPHGASFKSQTSAVYESLSSSSHFSHTFVQVAVKVIDKRKAKKDSYVTKNLRREGHIQQMIRHPNITQLLDILETENSYYLVMELCPGGNLMNRIYDKKRLDERETQKYIRQLVLAVEHLHRAGVVHR